MKDVPTIMMVTYNRLDLTKQTFKTSLQQAGCKYNLIIVDNGSTDGTVEWLSNNQLENSIYVFLEKNMGIAYGRNLCLKVFDENFDSDYFCTLDNDVFLPLGWLNKCINVLKNNQNISSCGVNLEDVNYPIAKLQCGETIQIKPRGNLGTACAVFSKAIHDKIGFFNNLDMYGHEDALFYFRIKLAYNNYFIAYLGENGIHLGTENTGTKEYQEMKKKYWDSNMEIFNGQIRLYLEGKKKLYECFSNYDESLMKQIITIGNKAIR